MNASKQKKTHDASAAGASLTFEVIEGWNVYQDDGEPDLRLFADLDIAVQAKLAKPRSIRETIRGVIADGGVRLVGPAAAEVLEGIRKTAGSTGASKRTPTESDENLPQPNAIVRAEKVLVQTGTLGRSQTVVVFHLNREAALRVILRLRTPAAVELQIIVCRIAMLAEEGKLPAAASGAYPKATGRPEVLAGIVQVLQTALANGDSEGAQVAHEAIGRLMGGPSAAATLFGGDADSPGIGDGAARLHILNPLYEIARTMARAIGRDNDITAIRSLRMTCDRQLRRELAFSLDAAQSWASLPCRWFDHACRIVGRMVAESERMAGMSGRAVTDDGALVRSSAAMVQVELSVPRRPKGSS